VLEARQVARVVRCHLLQVQEPTMLWVVQHHSSLVQVKEPALEVHLM
jgi:hypothetical protein